MAEFILFSIVIIWLFCYYYPQIAKKTFLWLFVIFPIAVALYAFAPTFLAVILAVFMLIGAIGAIFNAYKRQKLAKL
ncbi:hypothetical protein [Campylobacter sp.]|uniref:hypothetical protein n=1 Tax=Campylobacter sp. TaxID=205 RepID=UPI002AA62A83|nr:hypothetical protein [Campylobacter sp.]MCI6564468.1 hypothetical protein [Campylobacter sp.]